MAPNFTKAWAFQMYGLYKAFLSFGLPFNMVMLPLSLAISSEPLWNCTLSKLPKLLKLPLFGFVSNGHYRMIVLAYRMIIFAGGCAYQKIFRVYRTKIIRKSISIKR
jgi:hypothetical protein